MGGYCFPVSATVAALVWFVGRVTWAKGYAASEGDPKLRYSSPFAYGIWTGYLASMLLAVGTGVKVRLEQGAETSSAALTPSLRCAAGCRS